MTTKTYVIIGERSGSSIDKSNSGSVTDYLARQRWGLEGWPSTPLRLLLADELASNEPSCNKSHVVEELISDRYYRVGHLLRPDKGGLCSVFHHSAG
jgi:hypothetical protein